MTSTRTKAIDAALRAAELEAKIAARAREDDVRFAEYTLSSERTGLPLVVEDGHYQALEAVNKYQNVVVIAGPKTGKTTFITYARTVRKIGLDRLRYRAKLWSAKLENATRHTLKIRNLIEHNPRVRRVFPELEVGDKWTESEWAVRRPAEGPGIVHPKEPTMWACGMEPSNQGFRSDDDIFDDVIDPKMSLSRYQCEKMAELVMDNVSRVEADGKRIWVQNCNRRWDTGYLLVEKYGWHLHLMPVINDAGRTLYSVIWPQKDCDSYPPARKDQDLRCIPKREGDSCFQEAYLQHAMVLGEGLTTQHRIDFRELASHGVFAVTAVDPAGGKKKKKSDLTAFVTVLVGPPSYWGQRDPGTGVRMIQVLNVTSGKMSGPEIRGQVIDHHRRYGSVIYVEDVATQDWMRQMLAVDAPDVPVAPFPTNRATKHHQDLGFESMASRLSMGLIAIPSYRDESGVLRVDDEVKRMMDELRIYDPESHTGDRAMALWIADVTARLARFTTRVADTIDLSSGRFDPGPSAAQSPVSDALRQLGVRTQARSSPDMSEVDERVRRRFGF